MAREVENIEKIFSEGETEHWEKVESVLVCRNRERERESEKERVGRTVMRVGKINK